MAKDEMLVIDRTYELVKWFLNHLAKFPRSHRYGLGQQIESRLYAVFERLIHARYTTGTARCQALAAVNLHLEVLRMFCRLAQELAFLPHRSHEYAAREIDEIGRMVGGWLRQQQKTASSSR